MEFAKPNGQTRIESKTETHLPFEPGLTDAPSHDAANQSDANPAPLSEIREERRPINCVEAGLKSIERGFQVFALKDGTKNPLNGVSWLSLRTCEPERAKAQLKSTSSYGVATGDRLVVIDVDCRDDKPGLINFDSVDREYGFPETFTVRTRSGGKHLYYRLPLGMRIKNDATGRCFGEGIDVKGHNGYVVGPGSVVEGLSYTIEKELPVADAAPWMLERFEQELERGPKVTEPLCPWDLAPNIERARYYLQHEAPPAIQYDHGDQTTLSVAMHVRDYAISKEMCFELMMDHYNERCEPPWWPDEMKVKVANGYRYPKKRPGTRRAGLAEGFEPAEILEKPKSQLGDLDIEWIKPFDPTQIPKRAWVLGRLLARGYVTELVSPPGAGKTTLELLMAVAIAAGRGDIVGIEVRERTRVFVWNQEDELDELKRRLAAVLKAFNLSFDNITLNGKPMIVLGSGASKSIKIARVDSEEIRPTKDTAALVRLFVEEGIGVAMFDPLIELHPAKESDNDQLGAVARIFRSIAIEARCAVMLAHHTRKLPAAAGTGHFGNLDSGRGASSLSGVIRMAATLYTIDHKTAKAYGVTDEERNRYVRLDDAKNNLALIGAEPVFFRREGINIGTFEEPEEVGVLRLTKLEKPKSNLERESEALLQDLEDLLNPGEAAGVPEIARKLSEVDPVMHGDDHRVVSKKIARLHQRGKLPGFTLEKVSGRRGSKIIREAETRQEER
jgi:hypothetical protein